MASVTLQLDKTAAWIEGKQPSALTGVIAEAVAKMKELGLKSDLSKAVKSDVTSGTGNESNLIRFIHSVGAVPKATDNNKGDVERMKAAQAKLIALHATLYAKGGNAYESWKKAEAERLRTVKAEADAKKKRQAREEKARVEHDKAERRRLEEEHAEMLARDAKIHGKR